MTLPRIRSIYVAACGLFICSVFVFPAATLAQKGEAANQMGIPEANFSAEVMNQLKSTTTVFFYHRPKGIADIKLESAIKSAWDFNTIIFDDYSNERKYLGDPHYSYFTMEAFHRTTKFSNSDGFREETKMTLHDLHVYIVLRLTGADDKGRPTSEVLARIELFPDKATTEAAVQYTQSYNMLLYTFRFQGSYLNWSPVLLAAQLKAVNLNLTKSLRPGFYKNIKIDRLQDLLKNDTLYVPLRLLVHLDKKRNEEMLSENIFESYPYKYKICTDDQLYKIFCEEKTGRLLFEYVLGNNDKFITVYDFKTNGVVYRHYSPLSMNIKSKDIQKLVASD